MPTGTDLRDVFDLLERQADGYDLNLDVLHPVRHRRPSGRLPAMLVAAATVAALAVGGSLWVRQGDRPALGGGTRPAQLPVRTLPFALPASSGWRIGDTRTAPDAAMVTLLRPGHSLQLEVYPAGAKHLQAQPGVADVRVGNEKGWFADGTGPGIVSIWKPQWNNPSSPDPGRAVDATEQVVWHYAPNAWAILKSYPDHLSRSELVAAAEALDFSRRTALRVPFRLAKAPGGESLGSYALTTSHGHWSASAGWGTDWTDFQVELGRPKQSVAAMGGEKLTVAGHPASWWGNGLSVDLAPGLLLEVVGPSDDEHPGRLTRDEAVTIAESVTLAPKPEDRRTWFRAATALP